MLNEINQLLRKFLKIFFRKKKQTDITSIKLIGKENKQISVRKCLVASSKQKKTKIPHRYKTKLIQDESAGRESRVGNSSANKIQIRVRNL